MLNKIYEFVDYSKNATISDAKATISKANDEIEILKSKIAKLEGENAMRRRKTYGKNGEKSSPVSNKGKTKDELEDEYIESEGKRSLSDDDDDEDSEGDGNVYRSDKLS